MSAREKSDLPEVAEKQANKAALAAAEFVERRGGAKENRNCKARSGRRAGSRVTGAGPHTRSRRQEQTGQADGALASPHHRCSAGKLFGLKKSAAPGVDEITWTEDAEGLEDNLSDPPLSRSRRDGIERSHRVVTCIRSLTEEGTPQGVVASRS